MDIEGQQQPRLRRRDRVRQLSQSSHSSLKTEIKNSNLTLFISIIVLMVVFGILVFSILHVLRRKI